MKRKFEVKIIVENDFETLAEGLQNARATIKNLGLAVQDCKPIKSTRTLNQNNALWLLFTQLSKDLNEKGLDMRTFIRQEVEISWTPYNVNQYLWKPLLKALTGKNSTTKMDKTGEIELVYENLNRILIERTKGEVCLMPFPSMDSLIDNDSINC